MGILTKYLCREFFKLLVVCQGIFIFLYLIIDFTEKIDNFVDGNATNTAMLLFFIYKIPLIAIQMAPAAVLISVIVLFSLMKKNNEIIALKASGISTFSLSLPILFASMGLTVAVFLFSELVVPYASTKSNDIWQREVEKKNHKRFYNYSNIWYRGTKAIYWLRHFDEKQMKMESPAFYFFDDSFRLTKKIDAKRALWKGDRWKAEEGIILQMGDGEGYHFERFKEMDLMLPEGPDSFLKTVKRPEEMSYWELKHYAEKTAREGYDDTRYLVDLNGKLAFSLLSFVMVLTGIPAALGLKKGGTPLAVSLGFVACFIYYLIHALSRSLGLAGVLPPVFAAWLASLAFLFFGIYLMIRVET